jgi:hypothetical protein
MSSQQYEGPTAYRALAKRARRLAATQIDGPVRDELLRYAEELEKQADELEQLKREPPA